VHDSVQELTISKYLSSIQWCSIYVTLFFTQYCTNCMVYLSVMMRPLQQHSISLYTFSNTSVLGLPATGLGGFLSSTQCNAIYKYIDMYINTYP
jgi:hypothetical protein